MLADGDTIRIGLLKHGLVEILTYLALSLYLLVGRKQLLGGMYIHRLALEDTLAKTYLATRFGGKICLYDVAVDASCYIARHLDNVLTLLLHGLRNTQHIANLLENTVQLVVEVVVIVDDTQMRMTRPGTDNLLVELAGYLKTMFVGTLQALGIVARGIKLLGAIGC